MTLNKESKRIKKYAEIERDKELTLLKDVWGNSLE